MMFRPVLLAALLGILFPGSVFAEGTIWNSLTPQQQETLSAGKPVLVTEEIADNPWPRFIVYHLVEATPAQAAAVFWDCELDSFYIPNCLSVRMVCTPKPWIHDGEYTLKMPMFLPNEVYVSRNELRTPSSDVYEISWNVLHAQYIKGSIGNLTIEAQGQQSLMRYTNLVRPGSSIAGLLRGQASVQVVETVKALAHQIRKEVQSNPRLLEKQMQNLKRDLGQ